MTYEKSIFFIFVSSFFFFFSLDSVAFEKYWSFDKIEVVKCCSMFSLFYFCCFYEHLVSMWKYIYVCNFFLFRLSDIVCDRCKCTWINIIASKTWLNSSSNVCRSTTSHCFENCFSKLANRFDQLKPFSNQMFLKVVFKSNRQSFFFHT